MIGYDLAFANLENLISEIDSDDLINSSTNEAEVRAKFVTRVLRDVLGWPESKISREEPVADGFLDYKLRTSNLSIIVEAKRTGKHFAFPVVEKRSAQYYVIRNLRSRDANLAQAVLQARGYADKLGCEFACVTNGPQWGIFRAITPGTPWDEGKIRVFRTLAEIESQFVEFWNLLSYSSVLSAEIRTLFSDSSIPKVPFIRPIESLPYGDNPLQRNPLSPQIQPLISALFRDITSPHSETALRECYVSDRKVELISDSVKTIFHDTIPRFAKEAGFQDLIDTETRSGALDTDFKRAVDRADYGTTILLLGGVGSGKTTFIHRFFRVTAGDFVRDHCRWFYVPFTEAPQNPELFLDFLRKSILEQSKQANIDSSSIRALRSIYKSELESRKSGVWANLPEQLQLIKESEFLEQRVDSPEHCDYLIRHIRAGGAAVVIVLDNVDQRELDEQKRVFLLGNELCNLFDAIVLVALREESYFQASRTGVFNAYHTTRYHIASPDVRKVLRKRLELALQLSTEGEEQLREFIRTGATLDTTDILHFMEILKDSALDRNPAIGQFVDSLCQGNVRDALDMFNQFMVSGSTNAMKMLDIHRKTGKYHVAEHEFVKAVMLGDYQFYRESRSRIINVYSASASSSASNCTALRILSYLDHCKGMSHPEGPGFTDLPTVYSLFDAAFGGESDAIFHIARLAEHRLVETETRDLKRVNDAQAIRITVAGVYVLKTLCSRFVYLDLVSLDTPVWDVHVAQSLSKSPGDIDLYARIERVEWFLCYLKAEQARSLSHIPKSTSDLVKWPSLIDVITGRCHDDVARVMKNARLSEERILEIRGRVSAYTPHPPTAKRKSKRGKLGRR